MARKKTASVRLRTKLDDGTYAVENAGAIVSSDYAGSYTYFFEFDTDAKDENGYTVRDRVVALKTASGRKIDITNGFLNITVWDEMDAKPPRSE